MASQPQGLPILYNDLVPMSSVDHADWKARPVEGLDHLKGVHALPLTVDEFIVSQRHFPIVFSTGPDAVPLALMGLNEGVNVFIDDEGKLSENIYLPAYIRRYPFMLARLQPDAQDMSLCFDPTSGLIAPGDEGAPLFEDGQPTEQTKNTLAFCEQFEVGAQKTQQFMKELEQLGLLQDGEVTIQTEGNSQPYIYRGFQMVNEEKLRELRGDQLRKINQNGLLILLYAHVMSLSNMSEIFNRQMALGKVPPQEMIANG